MRALIFLAAFLAACGQTALPAPPPAPEAKAPPPSTAAGPTAAQLQAMDFAAYPAAPFAGSRRMPDFAGAQHAFAQFHTRLREAAETGPNFAGHVAVTQIGCGASCSEAYLIDLATGDIVKLPEGGEDNPYLDLAHRADSALLKARWQRRDQEGASCIYENFVLRDGRLASLGRAAREGECPATE